MDSTVRSWGSNTYAQLGNGTKNSSTPMTVSGLSDVAGLADRQYPSLVLKTDGTVRGWGYDSEGELSDGTLTISFTPVVTLSDTVGQPTP